MTIPNYMYEALFSTAAAEKHRPMFRYEYSQPVRLCDTPGSSTCEDLGISSFEDYYQTGYTSQIQWSGDWHFATSRTVADRVADPVGKLECDDSCFPYESSDLSQCMWYVRFIERYGHEGQFDKYGKIMRVDGSAFARAIQSRANARRYCKSS